MAMDSFVLVNSCRSHYYLVCTWNCGNCHLSTKHTYGISVGFYGLSFQSDWCSLFNCSFNISIIVMRQLDKNYITRRRCSDFDCKGINYKAGTFEKQQSAQLYVLLFRKLPNCRKSKWILLLIFENEGWFE